ncbi:hypothetical protein H6P81_009443 [Aristolochia fimbriata]|uniref:Uncharacterized protein n=1 Tax=Aristolochia fimbriata TaxID=158543 RepID=A0AAV7EQD1_ARIFI|nr:hypothetical protein H6P81_009443 [Aristolochia fimbriata]
MDFPKACSPLYKGNKAFKAPEAGKVKFIPEVEAAHLRSRAKAILSPPGASGALMPRKGSTRTLPMKNVICRTAKRSFPSRSETTAKNNVDSKLMKDASMHNDQIRKQTYACVQASAINRAALSSDILSSLYWNDIEGHMRGVIDKPIGSFEVHGTPFEGNIYHGIEAYHSNSIGHKALEALGRMPTEIDSSVITSTNSSAIPLGSSLTSFNIDSCLQKWEPEAAVSSAVEPYHKNQIMHPVKLEEEGTTDQMTRNTFIPLSKVSHLVLPILSMALSEAGTQCVSLDMKHPLYGERDNNKVADG